MNYKYFIKLFIKGVPEVRVKNILAVPLLMFRKKARTNSYNLTHPLSLFSCPTLELMCLFFLLTTSHIISDLMSKHGHQIISICNKDLWSC